MQNALSEAFRIGDMTAEKLGFVLVDAEYVTEKGEKYLRLYIDKDGGVGIDDCERFSNEFSELFDKIDPISEHYCLEVSSPGADRILKTDREYAHFAGREVEVKLYRALNGKKEFEGILKCKSGDEVTVVCGADYVTFPLKEAVYVRLLFRFGD